MKIDGVFEGGGVCGIVYVGVICVLVEKGYEWECVVGILVGLIIVVFLVVGYFCLELKMIIIDIDYNKFMKRIFIDRIFFIGKGFSVWIILGIYFNVFIEEWIEELFWKKGVYLFIDLLDLNKFKIIVFDISNGKMVVFFDDLLNYGFLNYCFFIVKVVRMSSIIFFFFEFVKWRILKWK